MIEFDKAIVFIFVLLLFCYTFRLLYATRFRKDKSYIFIILLFGMFQLTIATFLDLFAGIIDEPCVYHLLKLCFTVGSIFYVIGIILWSGFTANMINDLERMASLDSLTGALNRNGLNKAFEALIEKGHSIIVIEHNLDLIKCADYIIDIGPEGGENGGKLMAFGSPEDVTKNPKSITGKYLKEKLR